MTSWQCFDTHCHLGDGGGGSSSKRWRCRHVASFAVMSTSEQNWPKTIAFCARRRDCVLGFGVHPWFAPGVSASWLEKLEALLLQYPNAFCGEAGLDKVAKWRGSGAVEFERQLDVFKQQLALATKLRRAMSVHCVHAHGQLVDLLRAKKELPPLIALHSFSGKAPLVETYLSVKLLRDRLYFGFSYVINARAEQRTLECLKVIPNDRLLLESDVEDAQDVDALMTKMIDLIVQAKGWTFEETVRITNDNAKRFYSSCIDKSKDKSLKNNDDDGEDDNADDDDCAIDDSEKSNDKNNSDSHRCCGNINDDDDKDNNDA